MEFKEMAELSSSNVIKSDISPFNDFIPLRSSFTDVYLRHL